ncbi:hypothetical protein IF1G_02245 [Cordyceps javanica]|uniref:Apple domain-containing protein n=1 Tax=Cordyceps javanica TaxID=43265 RepID=A0A545VE90_9HYPO|nr:hypothetical protein IF1G_02245 [Cordyceps javanica]TQW10299.1 PAN domain-containing protein [Cordyceps javanica]
MSRRYSSSTNASRVAEGTWSRPGFAIRQAPPAPPPIAEGADGLSQHTFFSALSIRSGRTGRIAKKHPSGGRPPPEPRTFYREATPPPPGSSHRKSEARPEPEEAYDGRYDYVAPPAPLPVATTCGLPRRKFCVLLWAVVVAVIVAAAVPVGVVFGLRSRHHHEKVTSRPVDATSTISPTPSTSSASAGTPTAPSVASTTITACPAANNTMYIVPNTTTTFKRLCGIDYTGVSQARELGSVWTTTMQECIFQCADFPGCTACGWGIIADDPGSEHRCWLKTDLKASLSVRAGWEFAILEQ